MAYTCIDAHSRADWRCVMDWISLITPGTVCCLQGPYRGGWDHSCLDINFQRNALSPCLQHKEHDCKFLSRWQMITLRTVCVILSVCVWKGFLMQECTRSINACFYCVLCVYTHHFAGRGVYVCCRFRRRMKWRADRSGSVLLYKEDSKAGEVDEGSWPGQKKKKSLNLTFLPIQ